MRTRVADVGAYCVAFELHCCVAGDVSALCARDWQAESGVACAWLDKGGGLQAAGETRRCSSCQTRLSVVARTSVFLLQNQNKGAGAKQKAVSRPV
ncbi:hypothetical protein PGIGA_G00128030 [Pangasianodon gigas]|uniref:Uncharacterized protein n=1 Tax=Pangasianodon gigas TaxID=30993 RepID=A0ACC5XIG0_PANGG|nr:hypothetical protein [Pangasianodon gigas]